MFAGMRTIVSGVAWTGAPPIVRSSAPSSTSTSASNGDVCSVRPWPASKANSVTLPPLVLARIRLAMPCGSGDKVVEQERFGRRQLGGGRHDAAIVCQIALTALENDYGGARGVRDLEGPVMRHERLLWATLGLALALASTAVFGAPDTLKSQWRSGDMKVDGGIDEWPKLATIAPKVQAAAANDGDVLHLVITTSDPTIRERLMISGVLVYLDPKNKKAQTFAIRVPPMGGRPLPGEPPPTPRITYVEVFGPGKDEMHLVELPSKNGIEAAAGVHDGDWYIEIALPLRASEGQPYAPGVAPGQKVIGLGLVTPDPPSRRPAASAAVAAPLAATVPAATAAPRMAAEGSAVCHRLVAIIRTRPTASP